MKPIALFSDRHMLPGLHVTLVTLLRSFTGAEAGDYEVHLFLDRVNRREKEWLRETHRRHSQGSRLIVHDYSPSAPKGGNLYYGSSTAYGRLALAQLLPDHDRCVYLDCDLLVNHSPAALFDAIDDAHVLVVDGCYHRKGSVDEELFRETGIDLNGHYFNSGVMGINLALWRERRISEQCEQLSRRYGHLFRSADQAILNTILHDSFVAIGQQWNLPITPASPGLQRTAAKILHFEHSPKPWDLGGAYLHRNYSLWKEVYQETAIAKRSALRYSSLKRLRKIAPATWKLFLQRLGKTNSVKAQSMSESDSTLCSTPK